MKNTLFLLSITLFCACNPTKRAQKQIRKLQINHPELFAADTIRDTLARIDTIFYISPGTQKDSTFTWEDFDWKTDNIQSDTALLQDKDFETWVILQKDTIFQYKIKTIVYPDTIEILQIDTLITTQIQKEIITKTTNRVPFWLWILIGILTAALLFFIIKKK